MAVKRKYMKAYTEMTKAELLVEVDAKGLQEELGKLGSDPKKVVNDDLIKLLESATTPPVKKEEVVVEPKKNYGKKMNLADIKEFLTTSLAYIVVDHDTSYTIKDDDENRVIEIPWGNRLIGKTREKVALHGQRQLVTRGCIQKMQTMTIPRVKIDRGTGTVTSLKPRKRFTLTPVEGYTESEIEAVKQKQRLQLPEID